MRKKKLKQAIKKMQKLPDLREVDTKAHTVRSKELDMYYRLQAEKKPAKKIPAKPQPKRACFNTHCDNYYPERKHKSKLCASCKPVNEQRLGYKINTEAYPPDLGGTHYVSVQRGNHPPMMIKKIMPHRSFFSRDQQDAAYNDILQGIIREYEASLRRQLELKQRNLYGVMEDVSKMSANDYYNLKSKKDTF